MIPDLIKMQKMTQTIIPQNYPKTVIEDMTFSHFIAQDCLGKIKSFIFYAYDSKSS